MLIFCINKEGEVCLDYSSPSIVPANESVAVEDIDRLIRVVRHCEKIKKNAMANWEFIDDMLEIFSNQFGELNLFDAIYHIVSEGMSLSQYLLFE